jgi:N-acetylneuraminate synthase
MNAEGVLVIAEAGVNHNGSVSIGKELIERAREAGADAIKFQSFKAERLVARHARKAEYQTRTTSSQESHFEMLARLQLDEDAQAALVAHAARVGIRFLSSPFDEESADFLESVGVDAFKIPSGEITNLGLLAHIAEKRKPMIVSTGMCTLGEVEQALATIADHGDPPVTLLHCVTEYPAPYDEVNLRAMETLAVAFKLPVGYSDHTAGIEMALAAVALGARVIEKHFTLDRTMEGPDHRASLEPAEFRAMTLSIRNVQAALGDGIKRPAPCEVKNRDVARKSLVAARAIIAGEELTPENVTVKRPGHGVQPGDLAKVLGKRVRVDLERDDVITWEVIGS